METANLSPRRLSTQELFEELKHSQHPTRRDRHPFFPDEDLIQYRSAREQATEASILSETETYLNIEGYLYSVVSLKELPDATRTPRPHSDSASLSSPSVALDTRAVERSRPPGMSRVSEGVPASYATRQSRTKRRKAAQEREPSKR